MYDVTRGLRQNGTFLLNTIWDGEDLEKNLPTKVKRYFAKRNITVYYINATKIAQEIGLGNRTNTILQSAFFRITKVIPVDLAIEQMKKFIVKSYGKKGEDVINKNYAAVDQGGAYKQLFVNPEWALLPKEEKEDKNVPAFIENVVNVINAQDGDLLPVSTFVGREDGTWQQGTAKYEKRGVASHVPVWTSANCIQCNKCAYVCPHASIRPFGKRTRDLVWQVLLQIFALPAGIQKEGAVLPKAASAVIHTRIYYIGYSWPMSKRERVMPRLAFRIWRFPDSRCRLHDLRT
jgi:pyruvate-ferredoxin/flavodoxin oxidoreductase